MCGRYTHEFTWKRIHQHLMEFGAAFADECLEAEGPAPSYNVAPTTLVPVVRPSGESDGQLEAVMLRWWLVPHWAKSAEAKYATFNARSEDAAKKPAFRAPFKSRRCVVPASGFYEWKKLDDGSKRPFYIQRADEQVMYFAGLWDRWEDKDTGEVIESCTVLTTGPNAEMASIHDRMPCILEPEEVKGWLDTGMDDPARIRAFLRPAADGILMMHPVDKRVGNARKHNDEGLIERT